MSFTHITVYERPSKRKTRIWTVYNKYDGNELGGIAWFGRWRKYAFFPEVGCVFEEVCMRELSDFIVEKTKEKIGES